MRTGSPPDAPARRLGRPLLPSKRIRSGLVDVRVSAEEAEQIQELADKAGLKIRIYMRLAALGTHIAAPPDPVTLDHAARLAQIGRLLARLERLAIAGSIVGLPPQEIADLRRLTEAAAVAVLRPGASEEGEAPSCSP
ncbi:hypothetical protein PUR29_36875 [Methylobacterium ajmalii]|uniref:Mobilization protein n=1 Tax=Methylobacterium ajmalii TaxID=2738439 RepID=A0ABV0A597_9HYPH